MQVTILKTFLHEGERFIEKDIRTVNDSMGEYFCRAGWAEDMSGAIPTGNPDINDTVLKVENSTKDNPVSEAQ